jgi:hypothetical protein
MEKQGKDGRDLEGDSAAALSRQRLKGNLIDARATGCSVLSASGAWPQAAKRVRAGSRTLSRRTIAVAEISHDLIPPIEP